MTNIRPSSSWMSFETQPNWISHQGSQKASNLMVRTYQAIIYAFLYAIYDQIIVEISDSV